MNDATPPGPRRGWLGIMMGEAAPARTRLPPRPARSTGTLEAKIRRGEFVLTAEITPPDAASEEAVVAKIARLKGRVDAVNVTDGAGARAHMAAFAAAALLARNGVEPILQFTVRDRNRLALEGELIGAPALGIPSILCLHGDDIASGDQPEARAVNDIDSRTLMGIARALRDAGTLPSGRAVTPAPRLYIGAADTPKDPAEGFSPDVLLAKIAAGADFFQTQFVFDLDVFARYLGKLVEHGITAEAAYIVGVGPIASAKSARWMNDNLFGVHVPEPVIARLEAAGDQGAEGARIAAEIITGLRGMKGVAGAHIMAPRGEAAIAGVLDLLAIA